MLLTAGRDSPLTPRPEYNPYKSVTVKSIKGKFAGINISQLVDLRSDFHTLTGQLRQAINEPLYV